MDQAGFHTIDVEKDLAGSSRVIAGRRALTATALLGDPSRCERGIGHG